MSNVSKIFPGRAKPVPPPRSHSLEQFDKKLEDNSSSTTEAIIETSTAAEDASKSNLSELPAKNENLIGE